MRPELVKQAVGEWRRVVCSHGLGAAPPVVSVGEQHVADLRAEAGLASELGAEFGTRLEGGSTSWEGCATC